MSAADPSYSIMHYAPHYEGHYAGHYAAHYAAHYEDHYTAHYATHYAAYYAKKRLVMEISVPLLMVFFSRLFFFWFGYFSPRGVIVVL